METCDIRQKFQNGTLEDLEKILEPLGTGPENKKWKKRV
jgi:hypothetical protein